MTEEGVTDDGLLNTDTIGIGVLLGDGAAWGQVAYHGVLERKEWSVLPFCQL
jgi:hypothetical protein